MRFNWKLSPGFWGEHSLYAKKAIGFVMSMYEKYIDSPSLEEMLIVIDSGPGPKACPRRLNEDYFKSEYPDVPLDYLIQLSCVPVFTQSLVFQFTHEFGHLLMDCFPQTKSLKWISECICEVLSLFVLYSVDKTGNWKTISQEKGATTNYSNGIITPWASHEPRSATGRLSRIF